MDKIAAFRDREVGWSNTSHVITRFPISSPTIKHDVGTFVYPMTRCRDKSHYTAMLAA